MPGLSLRQLVEFKAQQLLVNVHGCSFDVLRGEELLELLLIEIELLFLKLAAEVRSVPFVPSSIRVLRVIPFELSQFEFILLSSVDKSTNEVIFEDLYVLRGLGHPSF